MVKRCAKCSSLNINSYAKSMEKFTCEDCGHVGEPIYEDDEFEELGVED